MTVVSFEPEVLAKSLPTPFELQKAIPLSDVQSAFIGQSRKTLEAILNGRDPRKILIVGPCSIHDYRAAVEYAHLLSDLSERVSDQFFIVMRTYFEKPRTIGGWKGFLYDPDLDGSHNLARGISLTRQLLSDITDLSIPVGCELLELNTSHYYSDFLSWGCIGARTSASPPHRQLAASLDFPIGFKNSTDGNVTPSIHGVLAASTPHVYLGMGVDGQVTRIEAEGNPLCHLVLRGGTQGPNYSEKSLKTIVEKCNLAGIRDRLIIDCSHDNCHKEHRIQSPVFQSLAKNLSRGNTQIMGLMLESNLKEGRQPISSNLEYGISVTDPCLNWEITKTLILQAHALIQKKSYSQI